jgi:hypothetical protein
MAGPLHDTRTRPFALVGQELNGPSKDVVSALRWKKAQYSQLSRFRDRYSLMTVERNENLLVVKVPKA